MPGPSRGTRCSSDSQGSSGSVKVGFGRGLAGLGGVRSRGVTAVTTARQATRRSCYAASSGRPGGRVPVPRGSGPKVRRPLRSAGAHGQGLTKAALSGYLGKPRWMPASRRESASSGVRRRG